MRAVTERESWPLSAKVGPRDCAGRGRAGPALVFRGWAGRGRVAFFAPRIIEAGVGVARSGLSGLPGFRGASKIEETISYRAGSGAGRVV